MESSDNTTFTTKSSIVVTPTALPSFPPFPPLPPAPNSSRASISSKIAEFTFAGNSNCDFCPSFHPIGGYICVSSIAKCNLFCIDCIQKTKECKCCEGTIQEIFDDDTNKIDNIDEFIKFEENKISQLDKEELCIYPNCIRRNDNSYYCANHISQFNPFVGCHYLCNKPKSKKFSLLY